MRPNPDQAFNAITDGLDGFASGGLTAQVAVRDTSSGPGLLRTSGVIVNESGQQVGSFGRDYMAIADDHWRAFHMRIDLDESVRGGPFRRAFFGRAEELYVEHGIDDIQVSAEEIGSYLWAKEGFTFAGNEESQRQALTQLWADRGRPIGERAVADGDLPQAAFDEIDDQFREMAAGNRLPFTPGELADLGSTWRWTGAEGHQLWLGKETLIGWKWNGFRAVAPGS